MKGSSKRIAAAALTLACLCSPLWAQEQTVDQSPTKDELSDLQDPDVEPSDPSPWAIQFSLAFIPEDNGTAGDPSPLIPSFGVSWGHSFASWVAFEPSLDFFSTYYGYETTLERAIPLALENRRSLVIGTLLSLPFRFSVTLAERFRLNLLLGPAFDLRLCLIADGLQDSDLEDATEQTSRAFSYFWSEGRWFRPLSGLGADWRDSRGRRFGLDLRAWMPLYRAWTDEDAFWAEGWVWEASFRFTPAKRR